MTNKHTPGPWHRNIKPATKYCVIFSGRNDHIASIHHRKEGEEAEANHNLIAAAPELLAALELAYEHINGGAGIKTGSEFQAMWEQARAAIAKAKGQ